MTRRRFGADVVNVVQTQFERDVTVGSAKARLLATDTWQPVGNLPYDACDRQSLTGAKTLTGDELSLLHMIRK